MDQNTRIDELAPYDREAEIGVLGSILHNNDALIHAEEIVKPEFFFSPGNRRIFAEMLKMAARGEPIDEITLTSRLGKTATEQVGGLMYIAEMVDLTPVASNVAVYADIVLRKWRARQAIEEAQRFITSIKAKGDLNGQVEEFRRFLEPIVAAGLPARGVDSKTALIEFAEWMEREEPAAKAKTYTKLDEYLYGIAPRKPTVIAARPGGGKTTLVAQCVIRNAQAGVPALFFSLEMDMIEIIGRAVSARTAIDGQKILHRQTKDLYDADWDRIAETSHHLSGLPFWVVAPPRPLTTDQIESITRWHIEQHGVELVVIDHMRKIATGKGSIYEQQTNRICDLANMAKALNVAVLVACQINREGDDEPLLKHLEGSGAIEQESQAVVMLHDKQPNSNFERKIEGRIAKNRNGRTGKEELLLIPWRYTIE